MSLLQSNGISNCLASLILLFPCPFLTQGIIPHVHPFLIVMGFVPALSASHCERESQSDWVYTCIACLTPYHPISLPQSDGDITVLSASLTLILCPSFRVAGFIPALSPLTISPYVPPSGCGWVRSSQHPCADRQAC